MRDEEATVFPDWDDLVAVEAHRFHACDGTEFCCRRVWSALARNCGACGRSLGIMGPQGMLTLPRARPTPSDGAVVVGLGDLNFSALSGSILNDLDDALSDGALEDLLVDQSPFVGNLQHAFQHRTGIMMSGLEENDSALEGANVSDWLRATGK